MEADGVEEIGGRTPAKSMNGELCPGAVLPYTGLDYFGD